MSQDKTKLVSIIIPVYNAKNYLKKCLNSLIGQTYRNIEILLIDDGSSDDSLSVCQRYAEIDSRVKVVHKGNGGVSSARNLGLKHVSGKYVCFVDADDWMTKNAIELLINNMEKCNSDFCFGSAEAVGVIKKEKYGINSGWVIEKSNTEQFVQYTDTLRTELGPWAKLFKARIIQKNNIRFPEDVKYGEDRIFIWKYIYHCSILSSVPNVVYKYSQLNLTRACGRYYEKTNEWLYEAVSCYAKLFDANTYLQVQKVAMRQFDVCMRHYALHSNSITRDEAIEKIKHTSNLFENFLITFADNSIYSEIDQNLVPYYDAFFKDKNYSKLLLSLQESIKNRSIIENHIIIRNIIVRVKR